MPSIAGFLVEHAGDAGTALLFEDEAWGWPAFAAGCAARAAYLTEHLPVGEPPHIGVLLDNTPEFALWLGAAALARASIVGVNPTRRGDELARDVLHTRCGLLVTEERHAPSLDGLDLGLAPGGLVRIDSPEWRGLLAPYDGAAMPSGDVDPATQLLLLFTSGTSGRPKAVVCSQGRLAGIGAAVAGMFALTPADVCYIAMPMFHSMALMSGFAPALAVGATLALRRRFSASGFLPDVRRFGATYANYVGKPLSHVLATPGRDDDADNPLRVVFGNEGVEADLVRFGERFGCRVVDGYGSTEGGANVSRATGQPPGSFGVLTDALGVRDPETGAPCPVARFGADGTLANAAEAVGELVSSAGPSTFEGYWDDPGATSARLRDGLYWTGDLVYSDDAGFLYFAGRSDDWLRVDGENLAAAPVERVLARHPEVVVAAVYAVPDVVTGDQLVAALQLAPGVAFDPAGFTDFLVAQADLGTTWVPRFVRVGEVPLTASGKVLKRSLRAARWGGGAQLWWREGRGPAAPYRLMSAAERERLEAEVAARAPSRVS